LIISTPHDLPCFKNYSATAKTSGLSFSYAEQPCPTGWPRICDGADFIGSDSVALVLGDNIFYGSGLGKRWPPTTSPTAVSCTRIM